MKTAIPTIDRAQVAEEIKATQAEGLLYFEKYDKRSNISCDVCGKSDTAPIVLSLCGSKEQMEDDPMSGGVYIFGTTCWNKMVKEFGIKI